MDCPVCLHSSSCKDAEDVWTCAVQLPRGRLNPIKCVVEARWRLQEDAHLLMQGMGLPAMASLGTCQQRDARLHSLAPHARPADIDTVLRLQAFPEVDPSAAAIAWT